MKECLKLYSFCEIFWLNNCTHCVAWQKIIMLIRYGYLLFTFVYLPLMESSQCSPTIQEPSKDKKTLSLKKALCIVLFGDMGYFIFHFNKKTWIMICIKSRGTVPWRTAKSSHPSPPPPHSRTKQRQNFSYRPTPLYVGRIYLIIIIS